MHVAEQHFGITYDGPALVSGAMPVRELAPSLLSLGEIFTAASLVRFPDREPVSLHIKATAEGSFEIELIAHTAKVFDEAIDIFSSNPVQALEGFVFSIVGARNGLFWLINSLRGQDAIVEDEESTVDPGEVTLTLPDGTALEGVATDVLALYRNMSIRNHAREVVAPLAQEGVDEIRFDIGGDRQAMVREADLPAYEVPPTKKDVLIDVVQPMVLDVISPDFEEGKWLLHDGDRKFSAAIEDETFIARIDAHEPFSKGDTLHCDVRVVQTRTESGRLDMERHVVRVKAHHRASGHQPTLEEGAS